MTKKTGIQTQFPDDPTSVLLGDGTWGEQTSGEGESFEFPVGWLLISAVNTNPATFLGYGTWAAFGAGRVLVGLDSGDADFDTVEKTGGAKTVTLTEAQMPAHVHDQYAPRSASGGSTRLATDTNANGSVDSKLDTGAAGGGGSHANVQPYIVVYFWKRTA